MSMSIYLLTLWSCISTHLFLKKHPTSKVSLSQHIDTSILQASDTLSHHLAYHLARCHLSPSTIPDASTSLPTHSTWCISTSWSSLIYILSLLISVCRSLYWQRQMNWSINSSYYLSSMSTSKDIHLSSISSSLQHIVHHGCHSLESILTRS